MTISPLGFGIYQPPELPLDRTTTLKQPVNKPIDFETQPTLPIVVSDGFNNLVYQPGRVATQKVVASKGRLLGIA